MKTSDQTIKEVGTLLGHRLFHDLMGGGHGQVPVDKEAVVIALVFDLEADLVAQDLERVQDAAKVRLFEKQAAIVARQIARAGLMFPKT